MAYSRYDVSEMLREVAPGIYGQLDLESTPERFRTKVETDHFEGLLRNVNPKKVKKFLEDKEQVELYRQLTLMGDPIADAFAVKTQELGFKKSREMLEKALDEGIEHVPDAPKELVALILDLEKQPEWLDFERIERYHNNTRMISAIAMEPFIRLGFMMTYENGYAGLPMIMTGTLSSESAAKRMKETTSTLRMATLPGALRRDGVAFRSAAMVRVMHAMVRMNLLKNKEKWDFDVYGVPIPQVDQMGAALLSNFILALRANKRKKPFSRSQKDSIDATRYLAFLLGLHDYFLSDKPEEILLSWSMLSATLRDKFDPRAKDLNIATLYAYTRPGHGLWDKFMHQIDVRNTRFLYSSMLVGKEKAKQMGVVAKNTDVLATVFLLTLLANKILAMKIIAMLPGGKKWVDDWAVNEMLRQLDMAGKAEYKTDESEYSMGKAA